MLSFDDIKKAIIESLTPDLLEKKYLALLDPNDPVETGHCYVASEAFFYLIGGKQSGFLSFVCPYFTDGKEYWFIDPPLNVIFRKETHWWTRAPKGDILGTGIIHDVTVGQYDFEFPYQYGRHAAFMHPKKNTPSKRARLIMDRVEEKLGYREIMLFREQQILEFDDNQIKHKPLFEKS